MRPLARRACAAQPWCALATSVDPNQRGTSLPSGSQFSFVSTDDSASTERFERPILLFGGSGQVGRQLIAVLAPLGTVVAPSRAAADLSAPESLEAMITRVRPGVVVNVAALTKVDQSERDPQLARAVNEIAPGVMASAARDAGAMMVHYSTDYVFGGSGAASRIDIAEAVLDAIDLHGQTRPVIVPVPAAEFGAAAPRPRYSALANERAKRRFGVTLDPWRVELRRMVADAGR
jgi:dTDP-4-dehydrorhamnose reductase